MPMGTTEKTATVNAIIASLEADANFANDMSSAPATKKFIEVLVDKIVLLITANALVSTTVTTANIGTLPAGPEASTGAGSGSGAIT